MPIAAIPQGVEIKKLTPTQEKALDKLLKAQRDENTLQTAIRVAIPTIAFVGVICSFCFTACCRRCSVRRSTFRWCNHV